MPAPTRFWIAMLSLNSATASRALPNFSRNTLRMTTMLIPPVVGKARIILGRDDDVAPGEANGLSGGDGCAENCFTADAARGRIAARELRRALMASRAGGDDHASVL